jgi:hypothetical protein
MWHLCVLDEVDPNQKSHGEEQFSEVSKQQETEGFLRSAAQTAGLSALTEADNSDHF